MKKTAIYFLVSLSGVLVILAFIFYGLGMAKSLSYWKVSLLLCLLMAAIALPLSNRLASFEKRFSLAAKILTPVMAFLLVIVVVLLLNKKLMYTDSPTCSMYHEDRDFDKWWKINSWKYPNITKEEFENFPLHNGIVHFAIPLPASPDKVEVGDIIVYEEPFNMGRTMHRVTGISEMNGSKAFIVIGDNNDIPELVLAGQVKGKVIRFNPERLIFSDSCDAEQEKPCHQIDLCVEYPKCCLLNESNKRIACFYKNNLSVELCCSMGNERKWCFSRLAMKNANAKFCEYISKSDIVYEGCVLGIATKTGDGYCHFSWNFLSLLAQSVLWPLQMNLIIFPPKGHSEPRLAVTI